MSSHALLAGVIRERVPASWRVIEHERPLDDIDAVTVQIKLDEVRRATEWGAGAYWVAWTVTVIPPHLDPDRADPAVFDALLELVAALDDVEWLRWTRAQKVLEADRYAFDITVDTIGNPITDNEPAAHAAGSESE
jgi:hypothetical protein